MGEPGSWCQCGSCEKCQGQRQYQEWWESERAPRPTVQEEVVTEPAPRKRAPRKVWN